MLNTEAKVLLVLTFPLLVCVLGLTLAFTDEGATVRVEPPGTVMTLSVALSDS